MRDDSRTDYEYYSTTEFSAGERQRIRQMLSDQPDLHEMAKTRRQFAWLRRWIGSSWGMLATFFGGAMLLDNYLGFDPLDMIRRLFK